jgi:kinesin family protein C1
LPKITSSQGRALGELQESKMNSRSLMQPPTTNKHKPSGCKLFTSLNCAHDELLTLSVPEPAFKRKTLAEKAGEIDRKLAAPPNPRPVTNGVKSIAARGFAASTSRINPNKSSKQTLAAAPTFGSSMGAGARIPSGNARPKSAYGQHARSKSHHQGMRPATSMMHRDDDADDDDEERHERKGVQTFPISTIPTIPKETLKVQKNALQASNRRPHSLNVPPTSGFPLSKLRSISSPSNLRPITPVTEEPADLSCTEICNNLGALTLGVPNAVTRDSRIGCGTIPGKEPNLFLKPQVSQSQIPRMTPIRQTAIAPPACLPPRSTPRMRAPFLNRFTNERCPDFYNDRIEAMERDFQKFKDMMEGDMQGSAGLKVTIEQLQTRGKRSAMDTCVNRLVLN